MTSRLHACLCFTILIYFISIKWNQIAVFPQTEPFIAAWEHLKHGFYFEGSLNYANKFTDTLRVKFTSPMRTEIPWYFRCTHIHLIVSVWLLEYLLQHQMWLSAASAVACVIQLAYTCIMLHFAVLVHTSCLSPLQKHPFPNHSHFANKSHFKLIVSSALPVISLAILAKVTSVTSNAPIINTPWFIKIIVKNV